MYITNIYVQLHVSLLPYNRMLKNANFNKRFESAIKDFELSKFQFQIAL